MGPATLERNAVRKFEVRSSKFEVRLSAIGYWLLTIALPCFILFTASQTNAATNSPTNTTSANTISTHTTATISTATNTTVIIIVGAAGEAEYGSNFVQQAELWEKVCGQAKCQRLTFGLDTNATNDYDRLKAVLEIEPKDGHGQLWLVFIGHGTFDGKEAKFNLRGPDVTATELGQWLKPFHRPLTVIDGSSSSAPFINQLSGTNRVIMTATRSGNERNYARFGQYFAQAIGDPEADLDKDGQVSLLEAFLMASRRANEFYKLEGRIATEHALLDDNGDGLGTQADWFTGLRAVKKARDAKAIDGLLAQQFFLVPGETERKLTPEQRAQRDALERAVLLHREKKDQFKGHEDDYYNELERLLLALAQFYSSNGVATPPATTPIVNRSGTAR
jgi:hypothetical protein